MQKRIFYSELSDEFTKWGDHFVRIAHNPANGMYCYRRTTPEGQTYFEVFKAPITQDDTGRKYERYPSTSEFGFGTALCIRSDRQTTEKVAFYLANGFNTGRFNKFNTIKND